MLAEQRKTILGETHQVYSNKEPTQFSKEVLYFGVIQNFRAQKLYFLPILSHNIRNNFKGVELWLKKVPPMRL
ncbi:hypothetical protein BRC19_03755 [Candidatus Saccharibacteria bacterium QS_5_54_17]|nr:MAG: hypothetical protein BRC19_03755 [Candidatus Saccharibacteria bacterium QS_5_54_17]